MTHEGAIGGGSAQDGWTAVLQQFVDVALTAQSVDDAARQSARLIREALAPSALETRILLRSGVDRLRPAASCGERILGGRRRSARRREVLRTGTACAISLRRPPGLRLAILPLREDGQAFGVVEILLAGEITDTQWTVMKSVTTHAAVAVRSARAREQVERQVETLSRSARLAGDLLEARTGPAAVLAAARFCNERFGLPVAAWWAKGDPGRLSLLAVRGFGSRRGAHLRSQMSSLPRWAFLPEAERNAYVDGFRRVVDVEGAGDGRVAVLDAGSALLLVGGDDPRLRETLDVVRALLVEALGNLERVRSADRRNEHLDLGLAWTAHEVRGPLNGVKGVIDLLLATTGPDQPMRDLLERSSDELDDLARKVEGLLRWSVGRTPLRRTSSDLVALVRTAIASCVLETGQDRVVLTGPDRVEVLADRDQLVSAVANLIRNAMAYSPPDTTIRVRVKESTDRVMVSVQDRGAGVSPGEREAIFDPFVRGHRGMGRGAGAGLGLFIARRIAEAHGGYLWMESSPFGATFHIGLPRMDTEARPAADAEQTTSIG